MTSDNRPDNSSNVAASPGWLRGLLDGQELLRRLFSPVDIASLVFFRIFFGVIAFWHVWLQVPDVRTKYIDAEFHFKYYGFEWVDALPGELMHLVFVVMAASAIFIALGLFYRYAAFAFFLTHTYVLLIDRAVAWNHYYLITLIAFLLIFVPAHRAFSLDVVRKAVQQSDDAPAWSLWLLRGQMAIVYVFAGFSKLSSSDWLDGKVLRLFLEDDTGFPFIGRWVQEDWLVYSASYGGMLFDLTIVPLVLWRRTRIMALVMMVGFHLSNSLLFTIQVFPWLAIVATLMFLPPSWPRLGGQWRRLTEAVPAPIIGPIRLSLRQSAIAMLLGVYFLFQIVLPLRHFAYQGNAEWTNAGHFLAWRMLMAHWEFESAFFLTSDDPEAICEVDEKAYLYPFQRTFLQFPDTMVQFAHHVSDQYEERGAAGFEVNVWTSFSLNGRPAGALVDPEVDLATTGRSLALPSWVIHLEDATAIPRPEAERCPDPASIDRLRQIENALPR